MHIKKHVIILLSILLPLSLLIYFLMELDTGGNSQYCISNFSQYHNDFQTIAEKMLAVNEEIKSSEDHTVWIDYKQHQQVFCVLNGERIEMTEEDQKALNRVVNAFDSSTLFDRITMDKNRVTFNTEGNWYAVAYTVDDRKPRFMSDPKETFHIKVKKIVKHWYHIYSY
ncbi:MAG TPA: hypothetical protein VHR47_03030 [Bacillota bacterium]|nr:hypothetical protein [Bacillota bacterium]